MEPEAEAAWDDADDIGIMADYPEAQDSAVFEKVRDESESSLSFSVYVFYSRPLQDVSFKDPYFLHPIQCEACDRIFQTTQGLGAHRRTCPALLAQGGILGSLSAATSARDGERGDKLIEHSKSATARRNAIATSPVSLKRPACLLDLDLSIVLRADKSMKVETSLSLNTDEVNKPPLDGDDSNRTPDTSDIKIDVVDGFLFEQSPQSYVPVKTAETPLVPSTSTSSSKSATQWPVRPGPTIVPLTPFKVPPVAPPAIPKRPQRPQRARAKRR